ncbi:MAG: adenylyltransferase/cytidyltransferase family protein [Candidatus Vogelbacteria bacterium]
MSIIQKMKADLILNKGIFAGAKTSDRIIHDYKELKKIVNHCRGLGLRIVLTQGTFDMAHIGHGRYLQEAKNHGDILIVGVDSDEKVRARKGPERPVVPHVERLEMLTHLRPVDLVVLKEIHYPKYHLIKTVQPDVLIATRGTYDKKKLREVKKFCARVIILKPQATTSTSAKIRLMQINTAKKVGRTLTPKIMSAIEDALKELHN